MKKNRKKFKDTLAGKLLGNIKNPILDLVGDIIPGAGVITGIIKSITGDSSIPENDKAAILKELDQELELAKIEAADRDSARSREIELKKAGGSNWFQYIVGIAVLLGYGAVVYCALFIEVRDKELFYFIAGSVFSFGASLVAYYFGSSKGSADKNKLIG